MPPRLDLDGARAVVYERRTPRGQLERVIVFTGTQVPDWRNDRMEYIKEVFTGNRENLQSYVQAQAFTKGQMELARRDGAVVNFVGYSRGGLLASAMAGVFDRPAVVFNGAPLANGRAYLNDSQLATAQRQVVDLHLSFEPLLALFTLGGQRDAGTTWVVDQSPAAKRLIAAALARGGPMAGVETLHGLEALRLSTTAPGARFTEVAPVDVGAASNIAGQLLVAGEGMRRWAEFQGHAGLAERIDKRFKPLAAAKELTDLGLAVKADIDAARDHSFVLVKSRTLEAIGGALLTGTDLPWLRDKPVGSGALVAVAKWLQANGRLPAQAAGKITAVPTFGALEFLGAGRDIAVDHRISIDTIERLADGAVGLTWAGLGMTVSGGNLATAKHFESAGLALAQNGRYLMAAAGLDKALLRVFDWSYAAQQETMIAQYADAVRLTRRGGKPPPTPAQFFGGSGADGSARAREMLESSGFGSAGIARLQRIHDAVANAPVPAIHTAAPAPAVPGKGVAGVEMALPISSGSFGAAPAGSLDDFVEAARRAKGRQP